MKQKPDETPDEWVRQTLSRLPDAPPPGSSFDSERLWAQLRPELQATPVRKRIGWIWWAVAACLAGLVLGWFGWQQSPVNDRNVVATHQRIRKPAAPVVSLREPKLPKSVDISIPVLTEKTLRRKQRIIDGNQLDTLKSLTVVVAPESMERVAQTSELPTVAEQPPVVENLPKLGKPTIATVTPKRRFKVVHENELRAEEEARPKLYRTENFVRLGTNGRTEATSDENSPALIFPLTHKPNQ